MAVEELASFKTLRNGNEFGISVKLDSDQSSQSFKIILDLIDNSTTTLTITVEPNIDSFTISGMSALSSMVTCLATCAVGAVLKPLITCFNRNSDQYKACLKSKGVDLLSDAVQCALACAASAAGSP